MFVGGGRQGALTGHSRRGLRTALSGRCGGPPRPKGPEGQDSRLSAVREPELWLRPDQEARETLGGGCAQQSGGRARKKGHRPRPSRSGTVRVGDWRARGLDAARAGDAT